MAVQPEQVEVAVLYALLDLLESEIMEVVAAAVAEAQLGMLGVLVIQVLVQTRLPLMLCRLRPAVRIRFLLAALEGKLLFLGTRNEKRDATQAV